MPEVKPALESFAKIKVIGVGGSGNSAVNRMMQEKIRGVEFIAVNTDVQALHHSLAPQKLHIGKSATRGLGAGMDPEMGRRAAEESQNEIRDICKGADMIFITCGLGGGTGSGASPVVAEMAKESGALTVAVVTKPFAFEGAQRKDIADAAYQDLSKRVDTIISIPNDRILQIVDKKTSLLEAFKIVDDVLRQGVQGIAEIITTAGLINVDFADVKAIMHNQGSALMGIGRASGDNRAVEAAKQAIASPLLDLSIDGARGILFTITGSPSMTMQEVSEAAKVITGSADENAKVIFGAVVDDGLKDDLKITVIATGFDDRREVVTRELSAPERQFMTSGRNFFESVSRPEASRGREARSEAQAMQPTAASMTRTSAKPAEEPQRTIFQKKTMGLDDVDVVGDDGEEDLEIPAFIRKKMG